MTRNLTRVIFFTLGILVITIWSMAFYSSHALQGDMQRQLGDQQFSTTLVPKRISEELNSRVNALEQYANGRIVLSMLSNAVVLQERLEGSVLTHRTSGPDVIQAPDDASSGDGIRQRAFDAQTQILD